MWQSTVSFHLGSFNLNILYDRLSAVWGRCVIGKLFMVLPRFLYFSHLRCWFWRESDANESLYFGALKLTFKWTVWNGDHVNYKMCIVALGPSEDELYWGVLHRKIRYRSSKPGQHASVFLAHFGGSRNRKYNLYRQSLNKTCSIVNS